MSLVMFWIWSLALAGTHVVVGGPMPTGAVQDDWPFGVLASCVDVAGVVACGDVRVEVLHRPIDGPVEGAVEWRQTAGLEWTSGHRQDVAPDRVRWASASGGWESEGAVAARIERADEPSLEARLATCEARLERFPVVVLYDAQGVARRVRFQGFPPDDAGDLGCVAWAVGALPFDGRPDRELEISATASRPPPDEASRETSRTPPAE